jgi:hypothetical protein
MKGILDFFSNNSAFFLFIATFALAVITYFYLRETTRIRKTSEKFFTIETSPKVFLENIEFIPKLNDSTRGIEVTAVLRIKNTGKTEADKFKAKYVFSMGDLRMEKEIEAPYLYPSQGVQYQTKVLSLSLNEENFSVAKRAQEEKKALIVSENIAPPIFLNLDLTYIDQEGEEHNIPYKAKYTLHNNSWNFLTEDD